MWNQVGAWLARLELGMWRGSASRTDCGGDVETKRKLFESDHLWLSIHLLFITTAPPNMPINGLLNTSSAGVHELKLFGTWFVVMMEIKGKKGETPVVFSSHRQCHSISWFSNRRANQTRSPSSIKVSSMDRELHSPPPSWAHFSCLKIRTSLFSSGRSPGLRAGVQYLIAVVDRWIRSGHCDWNNLISRLSNVRLRDKPYWGCLRDFWGETLYRTNLCR